MEAMETKEIPVGRIVSISELNVAVLINDEKVKYHDMLYTYNKGKKIQFEVAEEEGNLVSTIPFQSVIGLKKGLPVYKEQSGLEIEYSDQILGKVFDSYGGLIDNNVIEQPKKRNVYSRNLTLEVTESLAINDMVRMKKILDSIKALGVKIALDDFGTGYSSLNHIREIPLDVIKVDQSFVKDLAVDQYAQAFVKMVGELADALNVKICVEGIETADQFKVLEGMDVQMIQGFYFDKPMPKNEFEIKLMGERMY